MGFSARPAIEAGRTYAFPVVWSAVLVAGIGLQRPLPELNAGQLLAFNVIPPAAAESRPVVAVSAPDPMLTFVRHEIELEEALPVSAREIAGGHGRFAAPGNAVRRQIQVRNVDRLPGSGNAG